MQVTGETLERAMAVLEGHSTAATSQSEPDVKPDAVGNSYLDNGMAENGGVEEGKADEPGSARATNESDADTGNASKPDARRTPQKRGHLRGL